jgi:acyl-CoA thioesterase FadM
MADVDAADTLYVATPFRWSEELFTGWLVEQGHPLSELLAVRRGCPTVATEASFHRPLRLDQTVECQFGFDEVGRSSFAGRMDVFTAAGELAVQVRERHVWTAMGADGEWRSERLPGWLRAALGAG